jgi:hypothetical protein
VPRVRTEMVDRPRSLGGRSLSYSLSASYRHVGQSLFPEVCESSVQGVTLARRSGN